MLHQTINSNHFQKQKDTICDSLNLIKISTIYDEESKIAHSTHHFEQAPKMNIN